MKASKRYDNVGSGDTKVEENASPVRDVALLIGMTEDGLQQRSIY